MKDAARNAASRENNDAFRRGCDRTQFARWSVHSLSIAGQYAEPSMRVSGS